MTTATISRHSLTELPSNLLLGQRASQTILNSGKIAYCFIRKAGCGMMRTARRKPGTFASGRRLFMIQQPRPQNRTSLVKRQLRRSLKQQPYQLSTTAHSKTRKVAAGLRMAAMETTAKWKLMNFWRQGVVASKCALQILLAQALKSTEELDVARFILETFLT